MNEIDTLDLNDDNKIETLNFSKDEEVNSNAHEDSKSESKISIIKMYGEDLSAKEYITDPAIGREKEIQRIVQILNRRSKNNPCLIGEPGVGKTAIAEGLALRIVRGDVPEGLKDCTIFSLDMGSLVAGAKYRGEFEEKLNNLISDVEKDKNTIRKER